MSLFALDTEIPFEEYKRTIFHHAYAYTHKMRNPLTIFQISKIVFNRAKQEFSSGRYDMALFFALRTMALLDPEKALTDVRKHDKSARFLIREVMDFAENILNGKELLQQYQTMIEQIKKDEPARQELIALQMKADTEVTLMDDRSSYNLRRENLLKNETEKINAFRSQLFGDQTQSNFSHRKRIPRESSTCLQNTSETNDKFIFLNPTNLKKLECEASSEVTENSLPLLKTKTVPQKWFFNSSKANFSPKRGIVNIGNSCYMNSVLQLINATPLAKFFLGDDYMDLFPEPNNKIVRVVNSFAFVVRELSHIESSFAISASSFKKSISAVCETFDNNMQQDANEFLRILLDLLHCGLNQNANKVVKFSDIDNTKGTDEELARKYWWQYTQKDSSKVTELCAFQERSCITCPLCGMLSRSFQTTFGVELPVLFNQGVTLEDCLDAYCSKEYLSNDSLYSCSTCKRKVNATKQLSFFSTPQILFITLKRFRKCGDFSNLTKVNSEIYFQRTLDLAPFVSSNSSKTKFSLVGIINHQGNMHGGHYTADTVDNNGFWYSFSDERVTSADAPDFKQAYILCYLRV